MKRLAAFTILILFAVSARAAQELPVRESPRPPTTNGVPHVQLGVTPDQKIYDQLLARVEAHEAIEIRPTIVSLPGALGFWIEEGVALARPDVIVRGREFAHLHTDGSLHASLAPSLAAEAVAAGWAIPHPWANQRRGWEGFVMIYTPTTEAESDVVYDLIIAGLDFVRHGSDEASAVPRSFAAPSGTVTQDPSQTCSTC
ncbi:MAG: luciferase family protein [Pseudomonadota bacterium]